MTDIEHREWTIYCAWSLDGEEFPASVDPEPTPEGGTFKVVRADAYQEAVDLIAALRGVRTVTADDLRRADELLAAHGIHHPTGRQ